MSLYNNLLLYLLIFTSSAALSQADLGSPQELGKVSWLRSFDQAMAVSSETGKPVFILFQEVPGCSTCRSYGENVLSHPVIVEIIENEFVPLAIYNNRKGEDAKVLKRYREPAWNNPVVRIVDGKGQDLISRVAGQYNVAPVMANMESALLVAHRSIPEYMKTWREEMLAEKKHVKQSTYSMYCFWTGEAAFGELEGILRTEPVWAGFKEGVVVTYDSSVLPEKKLTEQAKKEGFDYVKSNKKLRPDKDPQYYIKNSDYRYLPLSPLQKSRINSKLSRNENAENFLSPAQLKYYRLIKNKDIMPSKTLYEKDFFSSWSMMSDFN